MLPSLLDTEHARRARTNRLLVDALAERAITVWFQPVVDLRTGEVIEMEALARWSSPELGEVPPAEFVAIAERVGLIHELGRCVLDRALDAVAAARHTGEWGARRVSLNLSATQLDDPDLVRGVLQALADHGLPPSVLQLELTESSVIADMEHAAARLRQLQAAGVRIAVDDFGTGHANLAYLRDLPVDMVKIDRRFTAGVGTDHADTSVVRAIVALAGELRIDVTAEGVETIEQHVALLRLGCPAAQGFLYATARPELQAPVDVPRAPAHPVLDVRDVNAVHDAGEREHERELMHELVHGAAEQCRAPIALLNLVDGDQVWTQHGWVRGFVSNDATAANAASTAEFCTVTVSGAQPLVVDDAARDDRFREQHHRAYLGVPLTIADGHRVGTLCVVDSVARRWTPDEVAALQRLGRQAAVLLELRLRVEQVARTMRELEVALAERRRVEDGMRHLAFHDELTGLANRNLLMQRLHEALAARTSPTVLVCDIDRFKLINDGLGHPTGDRLLTEVAARLQRCVRHGDTVARLGGDEFVVLLGDSEHGDAAATRILDAMVAPFLLDHAGPVTVTMSIGIATAHDPLGGTRGVVADTGDTLLRDADTAMYAAKAHGGNRARRFEPAMRSEVLHHLSHLSLSGELRRALDGDELTCVFQPEFDLATGSLFGLEALVRWNHPQRGMLVPDDFLSFVDPVHGMPRLFEAVLRSTVRSQQQWLRATGVLASVSVNVAPSQLEDGTLPETVARVLDEHGTPPASVWVEVTESGLAVPSAIDVLSAIHDMGVHLAVDDFGTGWSSMSRLLLFPWDMLKIDRTFIDQLGVSEHADHVVRAIIAMAHSLGMTVVAEGVETADQLDCLRALGCDIAQGFLLATPIDAERVRKGLGLGDRGPVFDAAHLDDGLLFVTEPEARDDSQVERIVVVGQ